MDLVGLEESLDKLTNMNGMRWYELVLRRYNDDLLGGALEFEVVVRRGHW